MESAPRHSHTRAERHVLSYGTIRGIRDYNQKYSICHYIQLKPAANYITSEQKYRVLYRKLSHQLLLSAPGVMTLTECLSGGRS